MLATNTMLFTLALIVYQQTQSNAAVSALFLAYGMPAVLFGVVAGVIVDHFDKRLILILCDASRSVLAISLFFLTGNPFIVFAIVLVNAVINQFYIPSEAPTIPRLVPEEDLVSANSLFSFTYYSSLAIGFIAAGPMLRYAGMTVTYASITSLFMLAALFVSRIPKQPGTHTFSMVLQKDVFRIAQRVLSDTREGISYVRSRRLLFDALLLLTGTQVIIMILGTLGPGFADRVLEIDVRDVSLVVTAPVVLGIVGGALWVGNYGYRLGNTFLITTGVLSAGVILMLISVLVRLSRLVGSTWFFQSGWELAITFGLFVLLGVANSFLDVPANSILQKEADAAVRSRVYGFLTAMVGGVGMLPVVIGAVAADVIGVGKVIFILGFLITIYGIFRIGYNRA